MNELLYEQGEFMAHCTVRVAEVADLGSAQLRDVTEGELDFLATGNLGGNDSGES